MTSIIDSMVNPETYTQFLVRSKTIPQKYFRWSWLLSRARSYILICSRRPANYSPTNLLRITLHGPPLGVKIAWLLNLMSVRLQSFNPKYTNTISQFDPIVVLFFMKPCSLRILRSNSYFFITTFLTFYLFFFQVRHCFLQYCTRKVANSDPGFLGKSVMTLSYDELMTHLFNNWLAKSKKY